MQIYTLIVTYNSMRWAEKCFSSLRRSTLSTNVVVVDNGSTDGTVTFIEKKYPEIHLIKTGENLGFAKANNIGIRFALDNGASYVFLLNHDAWVEKNTLASLLQMIESRNRIGIVSPIHLTGDSSAIDASFSKFMPECFHNDQNSGNIKESYEINYVNAAAWLMNCKMIREIGGFDTLLFKHYGEDNNLCQRAKYFKWLIYIDTRVTICHDRSERTKKYKYQEEAFGEKIFILNAKDKYGDINIDYNMYWKTCREFVLMILWGCLFQFSRSTTHRHLFSTFVKVLLSRKNNIKGGLLYL